MTCTKCKKKIERGERYHKTKRGSHHQTCMSLAAPPGYAVGGDFYNGVEWMACWLLDNVEGETITEEQLRPWAVEAWKANLKRLNAALSGATPKP